MAGSFGFEKEHYDLSVKIADLSLLPALTDEPEAMVVAPGTSCRHQIKDLADGGRCIRWKSLRKQLREGKTAGGQL